MIRREPSSTIIVEQPKDTAVFTFARMNPPTIGHEMLLQRLIEVAKEHNADHYVFLSQTQRAPDNPLSWDYKRRVVSNMFPGVNISDDQTARTPFEALEKLGERYDNVVLVVGGDRAEQFRSQMSKYLDEFGIENFDVVVAGERDPDGDGVKGASASRARELAIEGDFEEFSDMLSDKLSDSIKQDVYMKIRSASGLEEDADNKNADWYRNMGLRGHFAYSGWG